MNVLWMIEARERSTMWRADGREFKAWGSWEPLGSGFASRTAARQIAREMREEKPDPDVQYRAVQYVPKAAK